MFGANAGGVQGEASMKSKHAGGSLHRWRQALLGGLTGLGVPMLLRRGARGRRSSSPAIVGVVAGLLGALVGGGLARRRGRGEPEPAEPETLSQEPEKERAREPKPHREAAPEPRRGPSGRERLWLLSEAAARTTVRQETAEVEERGEVLHEGPVDGLHS